jgi:hypothetical protein
MLESSTRRTRRDHNVEVVQFNEIRVSCCLPFLSVQEHDIGRFKPGLDNLNQPEGHIIFKDSPDGRTYTYVYQNWGGIEFTRTPLFRNKKLR